MSFPEKDYFFFFVKDERKLTKPIMSFRYLFSFYRLITSKYLYSISRADRNKPRDREYTLSFVRNFVLTFNLFYSPIRTSLLKLYEKIACMHFLLRAISLFYLEINFAKHASQVDLKFERNI